MKSLSPVIPLSRVFFCLAIMLGIFCINSFAQQQSNLWQRKTESEVQSFGKEKSVSPTEYSVYGLNVNALKQILAKAPMEFTPEARANEVILELPAPDGKLQRFRIEESPMMEPELAAKLPEIKTYHGQGIDDPTATLRFDFTPLGFHSQILSSSGTLLIDPYAMGDTENYISYFKRDVPKTGSFFCEFGRTINSDFYKSEYGLLSIFDDAPNVTSGATLRTYRTAVAATGEFTAFYGGTVAQGQAGIVTIMNRVNGIYERDLAIRLTLVGNNTSVVYTNSATDPYTNNNPNSLLTQNQSNLDSVIGSGNYDIGHVFSTAGGGLAGLGVVCRAGLKAQGETGTNSPTGDPYAVDYVAHEMGHQFNGNHTFNASDSNREASAAYEPGSGITIMGYAGLFGAQDLAGNSIDTFHVKSLEEIITFKTSGFGSTCGTATATGNTPPTVSAPATFNIPRTTPFALTATASDVNGDSITYDWEEYDLGAAATTVPNSDSDGNARPIFRPYLPVTSPTRNFPSLTYILNNANVPPNTTGGFMTGEILPSISRTMAFQVVVRDNRSGGGGINTATTNVIVNAAAGPFNVTAPNTNVSWTGNTSQTVTWNVAGTTANGINAANVRILLSTDGGQTFPTILAASTANDGSESVTIPNTPTTQARIKIEAVGNIFFDISNTNFTITAGTAAPFITPGTISIVSESCGISNGSPDPGETLTVSLPLSNTGTVNTANLVATLQATGGVVSASSQNYGVVTAGGAAVTRNFTFTVNPGLTCGSGITLTFTLADGATTFPNVVQNYSTGAPAAIFAQNFDSVTAPALPTGWTNVQTSGTGITWRTSTTTPNSSPNAAFANEIASVNAAALVTSAIAINSSSAQISFRNRFNLEDSTTAGVGYDGTVLEFSTNGGTTWTDIITGGGSFVSNGYTDTIATNFSSPIAGRQAWSGNSGGYVTTVVNLPASLNGQNVRFRWLTASDSSAVASGTPGQWVDDVQVIGTVCQYCATAAGVTIGGRVLLPNDSGVARATVTLTDSHGVSRSVVTGIFGSFSFDDVEAGETYILRVSSKRYTFAPQTVSPSDDVTDITITAQSE